MIRDPSDGTVREATPKEINLQPNEANGLAAEKPSEEIASGLPPEERASKEYAKRLKYWRGWLQNYHQEKSHARRGNSNEKHTQDGSSGHDQG